MTKMTRFFSVVVSVLVGASVAFSGYQFGDLLGWSPATSRGLAAFGGLIGFAIVAILVVVCVESNPSKPSYVSADDLNPGLYDGLGSGYHNGNHYHIVVPITDHKSDWSVDAPVLVMRGDTEIPLGQFTVSSARKVIRPCEKATA